jgi:ParB family chromosome partitioning protein
MNSNSQGGNTYEAATSIVIPSRVRRRPADDTKWKTEQEKQRREAAIATTTDIRILAAISSAVPVRLMKRDHFFGAERFASLLDEDRLAVATK